MQLAFYKFKHAKFFNEGRRAEFTLGLIGGVGALGAMNKLRSFKKGIEDVRQGNETALEASKKELTSIPELPELGWYLNICVYILLATLTFLKSLTLSFNKIQGKILLS